MMDNERGPSPELVGRIIRWMILGFFAFAILNNVPRFGASHSQTPAKPDNTASTSSVAAKPAEGDCSGTFLSNFSLMAMPLMPVSLPSYSVTDTKEGTGQGAVCGQRATLRYMYSTRRGDVIFSNIDSGTESKDVLIGGGEVLPGLERGLLGMKAGGERIVTMAPELGFVNVKTETLRDHTFFKFPSDVGVVTAKASLLSLSPTLPASDLKLRIIERQIGGDDKPVQCGEKAHIFLSLWKMDGTLLYTNEQDAPLSFTPGRSQLPWGIEQGVIGMSPGSKRTLILPAAATERLAPNAEALLKDVTLPHEILLAAVMAVSEPKTPAVHAPTNSTSSNP